MTFKEFLKGVGYLPATVFSGLVNIAFGSTQKDEGQVVLDENNNPVVNPSLLGLILSSIQYVARSIADMIANNKTAITVAFWSSLALAGAAALTVFLWPAALTAVTTFSIFGISIAGVVGADVLLQTGAVGALAFAATSVATYLGASLVNLASALGGCCNDPEKLDYPSSDDDFDQVETPKASGNPLGRLSSPSSKTEKIVTASNHPTINPIIHESPVFPQRETDEPAPTPELSQTEIPQPAIAL